MKLDIRDLLEKNKDPDYIVGCLNLLTPTEKSIVLILHSRKSALNVKQVQSEFIMNVVLFLQAWFQRSSDLGETISKAFDLRVKLLPYFDFSSDDIPTLYDEFFFKGEVSGNMPTKKKKIKGGIMEVPLLDFSQEKINYYKKVFAKNKIGYPSFEKINSDLEVLGEMGILMKRDAVDKKSKGLWFVNPEITFYLNKTKLNLYSPV